jgi:hypothetical protein
MTEAEAKRQLRQMPRSMTAGSVLHLLAELSADSARRAQRKGNETMQKQAEEVASALFVVGLGVDAVWPR